MTQKMTIINDMGFGLDSWQDALEVDLAGLEKMPKTADLSQVHLVLENDQDVTELLLYLNRLEKISISFANAADGRGFSLARALRLRGYEGGLRAVGHILADQYRHARQSGFDEVAILPEQAKRMAEPHWTEQVPRLNASYQAQFYAGPTPQPEKTSHKR